MILTTTFTKKTLIKLGLALSLPVLAMFGCYANNPSSQHHATTNQNTPIHIANSIKNSLQKGNYSAITPYIHPKKGVRFSMYAFISPKDNVFSQADFAKYVSPANRQNKIKFTWGEKDGTGELYITSLPNYLSNWVVRDTKFDTTAINAIRQTGNSNNNLAEFYPKLDFIEYSFKGSKNQGYSDWRVLRLVFKTHQGRPYLVGMITDEWTI